MAFVTVSTGVGGGIVQGGRLLEGRRGSAGSIGHVLADPAGPVCGCGQRGCLEAVASGPAIAAEGGAATAVELFARAAAGDPRAIAAIERSSTAVARTLAGLAALLDLDLAVLGGGVGLAPGYLAAVERALSALPARFRLPLAAARLGRDAGLIGAADRACRALLRVRRATVGRRRAAPPASPAAAAG
jgi:N-acylmannosamine kinase